MIWIVIATDTAEQDCGDTLETAIAGGTKWLPGWAFADRWQSNRGCRPQQNNSSGCCQVERKSANNMEMGKALSVVVHFYSSKALSVTYFIHGECPFERCWKNHMLIHFCSSQIQFFKFNMHLLFQTTKKIF